MISPTALSFSTQPEWSQQQHQQQHQQQQQQQHNYLQSPTRFMAVGLTSNPRAAADEEARAEVDVLNSRLEKTSQLTKKIRASLSRLEATGKSVGDVIGPLNGETKKLQVLSNNLDAVITATERLRQPADTKDNEEVIVRQGPDKVGIKTYIDCLKRIDKALTDMRASNIRANQQTIADHQRLVKTGINQLESHFDKLLRGETPRSIEPLHFITKGKPFPQLSSDKINRLGFVNNSLSQLLLRDDASGPQETALAKVYTEIRGPYMSSTLVNLAMASVNTAKKKNHDSMYKPGTNGIGTYIQAIEGLFLTEYENIVKVFRRDDWGNLFQGTTQTSMAELARTLRELNAHIKAHLSTDCYLAYEITEIVTSFSEAIEKRTGELKAPLATALKPIRDTAKTSLGELLDDTKRRVTNLQALPPDGAPVPIVSETMQRLQTMVEFIRPLSGIMISLGDGGWKTRAPSRERGDMIPSLAGFDVSADGSELFAQYCVDTIDSLLVTLDQKARVVLQKGGKSVIGVFLANSITIVERMIQESALADLMVRRMAFLDQWRKKAKTLYTESCKDVSMHLFDVIHTSRATRPTSGGGFVDSASILKGLSSKDKEKIKDKFVAFNAGFDDLISRHRSYSMEREVKQMFAKDIQQMLEPLYNRFWDRYHEVDKGKGKYVKYDKAAISSVFMSLY
ncbi:uncharacterized protein MKZ38_004941 [Zalerion maritima]|uniref:Exocyst complex protein EXO70 n=1 Tax=Zalerion maritima TaxID=339359 RepID=A0AAD5WPA2_9PEZI|nr:uncharacterized protein MKZ38_004941 [Zalerion maritima]